MDGVVDPKMAIALHNMGALGVLNLDGVHSRHDDPDAILKEISLASDRDVTALMQRVYAAPIKEEYIARSIGQIKAAGEGN